MSENSKLADERALYEAFDRMSKNTKRVTPSAPRIIQLLLVAVAIALICLAVKLLVKYLSTKRKSSKRLDRSLELTPDIANRSATSNDEETGMKTRTRGSHNISSKHKRKKPPAVSLYQIRQKQSPGSSSSHNRLKHISMSQAMSRLRTRTTDNESPARSNQDDEPTTSPVDVSQRSSETEEVSQISRAEESPSSRDKNQEQSTDPVVAEPPALENNPPSEEQPIEEEQEETHAKPAEKTESDI